MAFIGTSRMGSACRDRAPSGTAAHSERSRSLRRHAPTTNASALIDRFWRHFDTDVAVNPRLPYQEVLMAAHPQDLVRLSLVRLYRGQLPRTHPDKEFGGLGSD